MPRKTNCRRLNCKIRDGTSSNMLLIARLAETTLCIRIVWKTFHAKQTAGVSTSRSEVDPVQTCNLIASLAQKPRSELAFLQHTMQNETASVNCNNRDGPSSNMHFDCQAGRDHALHDDSLGSMQRKTNSRLLDCKRRLVCMTAGFDLINTCLFASSASEADQLNDRVSTCVQVPCSSND